jgi:glycerol-3-phosphate acyltransferase PlsY
LHKVDLREYGSGNIGMTNVIRTTGIIPGIIVLTLDAGKGVSAVLLAQHFTNSSLLEVGSAIAMLVGHNWSIFLKFKGGKGTATGIGALMAMSPYVGLIVLLISIPVIIVSRYMSLASIVGSSVALFVMCTMYLFDTNIYGNIIPPVYILYPAIGSPIIIFKHKENIIRLIKGNERKIGHTITTEK